MVTLPHRLLPEPAAPTPPAPEAAAPSAFAPSQRTSPSRLFSASASPTGAALPRGSQGEDQQAPAGVAAPRSSSPGDSDDCSSGSSLVLGPLPLFVDLALSPRISPAWASPPTSPVLGSGSAHKMPVRRRLPFKVLSQDKDPAIGVPAASAAPRDSSQDKEPITASPEDISEDKETAAQQPPMDEDLPDDEPADDEDSVDIEEPVDGEVPVDDEDPVPAPSQQYGLFPAPVPTKRSIFPFPGIAALFRTTPCDQEPAKVAAAGSGGVESDGPFGGPLISNGTAVSPSCSLVAAVGSDSSEEEADDERTASNEENDFVRPALPLSNELELPRQTSSSSSVHWQDTDEDNMSDDTIILELPSLPESKPAVPMSDSSGPSAGLVQVPDSPVPSAALVPVPGSPVPSAALVPVPDSPEPSAVLVSVPDSPVPFAALLSVPDSPVPSAALVPVPGSPVPSAVLVPVPDSPVPSAALVSVPGFPVTDGAVPPAQGVPSAAAEPDGPVASALQMPCASVSPVVTDTAELPSASDCTSPETNPPVKPKLTKQQPDKGKTRTSNSNTGKTSIPQCKPCWVLLKKL